MIQQVLAHYTFPMLSCAGLILFLSVFTGAFLWTLRPGSSAFYQAASKAPFEEENRHE